MKKLFQAYPFAVTSLFTGIVTGGLALVFNVGGAFAVILLLLQPILGVCIEILHHVRALRIFDVLSGDELGYLLSDSVAQQLIKTYLASSRSVHNIDHPLLTAGARTWSARVQRYLEEQSKGILSADLAPSQTLLREPELLNSVKNHLYATSLVNIEDYWGKTWGQNYLSEQGELVQRLRGKELPKNESFKDLRGSPVWRIFVHPRDRLSELHDVLVAHKDNRLYARVAIWDEVPAELRHDFMVIDDTLMEQLELDNGRPSRAIFFVRGGEADAMIDETLERFKSLCKYAKLPEEFPEIGLQ